jgi:hypothetical protein
MQLVDLTQFIMHVNALIDAGEYADISIDQVEQHIDTGDLGPWLQARLAGERGLSVFTSERLEEINDGLRSVLGVYRGRERKWGVRHSGLCLLIAWAAELIQNHLEP